MPCISKLMVLIASSKYGWRSRCRSALSIPAKIILTPKNCTAGPVEVSRNIRTSFCRPADQAPCKDLHASSTRQIKTDIFQLHKHKPILPLDKRKLGRLSEFDRSQFASLVLLSPINPTRLATSLLLVDTSYCSEFADPMSGGSLGAL